MKKNARATIMLELAMPMTTSMIAASHIMNSFFWFGFFCVPFILSSWLNLGPARVL